MTINEPINYYDIIEVIKKINNPFGRENLLCDIKKEYGKGFFLWNDLGNGIATEVWNYTLNKNTKARIRSKVSGTVLIFNLSSDIIYTFKDKKEYLLKKNHVFIGFSSNDFIVDLNLEQNKHYNIVSIGIKEELFLKLSNGNQYLKDKIEEAQINSYSIINDWKIDPKQLELLTIYKEKKLNESLLTNLFLESTATHLFHYSIEKIIKNINEDSQIDENKIKSLIRAKELIYNNYSQNLSIKDISYKSAMNECYLKKYFKDYYGMTINTMLKNRRLEVAKNLLQEDYSVKEVAFMVGYKHMGHFSKLFAKNFSLSPSNYKKQFS